MLNVAYPVVALGELCESVSLAVVEVEVGMAIAVALPEDVVGIEVAA